MYHICYSNPKAWAVSYQYGVYGNVQTGNDNKKTFWGKLIDLAALKPGDYIFFYVKSEKALKGLFVVTSEPYYNDDDLFDDVKELYPFRFNFKEVKHYDNPLPVGELAKLLQTGKLFSINSFERDTQGSFRGIRQITDEEADVLLRLFLKYNPKTNPCDIVEFIEASNAEEYIESSELIENVKAYNFPLEIRINTIPVKYKKRDTYIAQYENSLQGYIYYSIRRGINNVIEDLGLVNSSEWLMEVPFLKAQQLRSDILCLYKERNSDPHFYSIIETKKDKKISVSDLSQLIGYMKTFAEVKSISFNSIEGIYISNCFEQRTIDYLKSRKDVEKENPVRLIEYSADEGGNVTFNQIEI